MSRLESSHLTVFSRNSHLAVLTIAKYFIDIKVAFPKSLYFYCHKKCHSLPGISEKVHITVKFQKTDIDKYASGHAFFIVHILTCKNYEKSHFIIILLKLHFVFYHIQKLHLFIRYTMYHFLY